MQQGPWLRSNGIVIEGVTIVRVDHYEL